MHIDGVEGFIDGLLNGNGSVGTINITEHNAAMWGLRQDEIDLVHGRSEHVKLNGKYFEWKQEKCMSGEVMDNCQEQTLIRSVVKLHDEFKDVAATIVKHFQYGTTTVYVVDGKYYELYVRSCPGPLELPLCVRQARVVGPKP